MTVGKGNGVYGDRVPGVFGKGGSSPFLHICSAINGRKNYCKNFNITTNTWVTLKVSQKKNKNDTYIFDYVIDNKIVASVVNNLPADFKNVKVFTSNPWVPSFNGIIRNIELCYKGN